MSNDRNAFGMSRTRDEETARAQRLSNKYSATPLPGSKPVKVSREVPVTIIAKADGTREVVETDTAEPCYACKCCVLWVANVDTLRASMLEHETGDHNGATALRDIRSDMFPGCLVCQLLAGAADG